MLSLFEISALLLTLSAIFGWLNYRVIGLPHAIGLLLMALVASLSVIAFDYVFPTPNVRETVSAAIGQIDFFDTVMHGMLAFLLFASALHVDFALLKSEKWSIGLLATISTLLSIAIVGGLFWMAARIVGVEMPVLWALVFGALISPTDPAAVLAVLKPVRIPESLEVKIAGESLFNDGVAVVAFTVLLALAMGEAEVSVIGVGEIFVYEALGGAVIGFVAGYIAVHMMRSIDDYSIEILISLALVCGLYALAQRFEMSGPIAVVVSGLLVGTRGVHITMKDVTRRYLFQFWEVIDELLNSVLFLLIGLEVLVIHTELVHAKLAVIAIPIILVARLIAVSIPMRVLSLGGSFFPGSIAVLTWGGLRGGVSVALALSISSSTVEKDAILVATYFVVIFSIVVQGLTIGPLLNKVTSK